MDNIPILENWYIGARVDPYTAPECINPRICGEVHNHPNFRDGEFLVISFAKDYDIYKDELICESRRYKLGEPESGFEEKYPNARNRLINSIKKTVKSERLGDT